MEKIDFKKSLKQLYNPPAGAFVAIEVLEMQFVKIDGEGNPNTSPVYRSAVEWLYGVSYAMGGHGVENTAYGVTQSGESIMAASVTQTPKSGMVTDASSMIWRDMVCSVTRNAS